MRFPSLFRLPGHQQFEIKPRYYDPVKEFVEQRKAIAKGEKEDMDGDVSAVSRVRFQRRKGSAGLNTSLLQLIIALILATIIVGWLYFGNVILYASLVLIPVYFYLKYRKK